MYYENNKRLRNLGLKRVDNMKRNRMGISEYTSKNGASRKREDIQRDINAALMISSLLR
jgi:hypothetical protein